MNGPLITPSTRLIASQANFVADLGTLLTDELGVGLVACDLTDEGEILYGPVGGKQAPLKTILNIDGSPRQGNIRKIRIPESRDVEGTAEGRSAFYKDIWAVQKVIEVPLGALLRDHSQMEFDTPAQRDVWMSHIALVGDLSAREFLAENYEKAPEEKARLIKPVAEDLAEVADRMTRFRGDQPNVFLINSAALFAALGEREMDERAVNNFFTAAKILFDSGNFVSAAVLVEKASEIGSRVHDDGEDFSAVSRLDVLQEMRSLAGEAWYKSLDMDFGLSTYPFRLYRGMRSAWNMQDKTGIDNLLERATHLNYARANFANVAEDYLRRAWYATQRFPMTEKDWAFVQRMLDGAAALWIGLGRDDDDVEKLRGIVRSTEKLQVESRKDLP